MWCPDGYFLVREVFNECFNVAREADVSIPENLSRLGDVRKAIEGARDVLRKLWPDRPIPPFYEELYEDVDLDWPSLYCDALEHWLLSRFLVEERFNLFLVKLTGEAVRVSSEAAWFVVGWGVLLPKDTRLPYLDPQLIAAIAMGGAPFNHMFSCPAYVLNVQNVPEAESNVFDTMRRLLAPLNGAPLAWKARNGETPRDALLRLLPDQVTFPTDCEAVPSDRQETSTQDSLQTVLRNIWQAFPEGKGSATWQTVERISGHSRRNISRALAKFGGQEEWAGTGR